MCGTTEIAELDLPRSVEAPTQARRFVEARLCEDHGRAALAAAQLLVSELVTCAVLYGEPPITLRLECGVTWLRIAVTHGADGAATELPIDEDGGLRSALLAKLSRSWGVDRVEDGRRLWSLLPTGALPTGALPPRPVSSPVSGPTVLRRLPGR